MNHRAGFINGEGDGVGIHIDIPRLLWKEKLQEIGLNPKLVDDKEHFVVGHIFITQTKESEAKKANLLKKLEDAGFTVLFHSDKVTNSQHLVQSPFKKTPFSFNLPVYQTYVGKHLTNTLFDLTIEFEQDDSVHVASLSQYHVVYKVMGAGDILPKYYTDLANPLVASTMTLGHNRYSTNTLSSFFRVQPFSVLGHNGEINTIAKLRDEAKMIGCSARKRRK